MIIDDGIPRAAAVEQASQFLDRTFNDRRIEEDLAAHGYVTVGLTRYDLQCIAKVLRVGIGELSK